eukprot:TRINITY_DN24487_c0_g1_i1.p1 TRINITY_DN24487_c0_g1~~TRINITY_DN24487_c0_g1_i1.p1  ORF type:complete len:354 (+),score=50.60 TRINITY_DN24487_c0_g1_i1:83-1063(+)
MRRAAAAAATAAPLASGRRLATTLPVVDVGPWVADRNGSSKHHIASAEALRKACTTWGFFVAQNHGVSEDSLRGTVAAAAEFFALPQSAKDTLAMQHYRGYQGLGVNVTQGKRDPHEAMDFYHEPCPECDGPLSLAHNQWPQQLPQFRTALESYVEAMLRVGGGVMSAVCASLGVPNDRVSAWTRDPFWVMRAIHYPDRDTVPAGDDWGDGCGVHTDYGLLTFVLSDDTPGALSVQALDGSWHTVDPPAGGGLVVNIGDMLATMTGGIYRSTPHQVKCVSGRNRVSVPFFYEPSFDALLRPLVGDTNVSPVCYGRHLTQRVQTNFG